VSLVFEFVYLILLVFSWIKRFTRFLIQNFKTINLYIFIST